MDIVQTDQIGKKAHILQRNHVHIKVHDNSQIFGISKNDENTFRLAHKIIKSATSNP